MISISSLASVGSVRNSRAPARMDLRIKVLSQLALAGSTTAFGSACTMLAISSTAWPGSESRATRQRSGAISTIRLAATL